MDKTIPERQDTYGLWLAYGDDFLYGWSVTQWSARTTAFVSTNFSGFIGWTG